MPDQTSSGSDHDRDAAAPDAHGQAALLIVESILHGLREKGLLDIDDVLNITQTAAEVKEQVVEDRQEPATIGKQSIELIRKIERSLKADCK